MMDAFDVAVIGGGPAGMTGALALCRARKRVVLFDCWPPRNAMASEVHGFVTQDGTPPAELRRAATEQLCAYDTFEFRDEVRVEMIQRAGARFIIEAGGDRVASRRVLLCVGIVDVLPDLPGYRQLWGRSLFQCPYCHGWELRDRAWGYLANDTACLEWSLLLRAWTPDLVVFTGGRFGVRAEHRALLQRSRIRLEERPVIGLRASGEALAAVRLAGAAEVPREVLFVRPLQRQTALVTALVASLGLELDARDRVHVENHQTTVRGIYAAGDLATSVHGALSAAAIGGVAAHILDEDLTRELLAEGVL